MEDDLRTLSNTNILFKYADDINLLVPEISDVDINDKFSSVLKWAEDNRMIVNLRFLRNHLLLNGSKSDASSLGQLNVTLGRRSRHICVSLRVVLQSVTV